MMRLLFRRAAAVAGLTLLPLAVAVPANAANPYTAQEVCGAAFTNQVASFDINGVARTHLLRRPDNGNWCAVTLKYDLTDMKTYVGVAIGKYHTDYASDRDWGLYQYYAGPVRSSDNCVFVAGITGPDSKIFAPGSGWKVRYPFPSSCS